MPGLNTYAHIFLHVISIIASLAAGFLWMRSAAVKVPPIAPGGDRSADGLHETGRWLEEISENLDRHRQSLMMATMYNMAAAAAASIAALAQAIVFALNLTNDLMKL